MTGRAVGLTTGPPRGLGGSLRIGICAPYDLGRLGGVNSHIRDQARALRRLGHEVTVFGAASTPLPEGEISVGRCISLVIGATETPIGLDPRSWRRVAELFRARSFDVVHVHEPLMPLVPWIVVRRSPVPIVATFHTHREQGHRWYPRYRRLLEPLMARVSVRLAVSEAAKRTVAAVFPGSYEVVPNGIDADRFARSGLRPLSMPAGSAHVLYVGRLEPRKGVDRLIRAMTTVGDHARDARLVVVGEGPDRAALEALSKQLGVEVIFAGRVSDEALPAYLHAADVVCSPALGGESFGIVLLEAMAAGRPLVATRIEGYEELVARAGSVALVEADDVGGLAREIVTLLEDPALARARGERGVAFARAFDWSAVARRLESIYALALSVAPR